MSRTPFLARLPVWLVIGGFAGGFAGLLIAPSGVRADADLDEWAVSEGLALEIDATGFSLPTAIAHVPEPGPAPDDPAYYVAELRGAVKAVTNDRTVVEIGSVPTLQPPLDEMRGGDEQSGLAGLCLAPEQGLVFATFAYPDDGGILRNDIVRFDTGESLSTEVDRIDRYSDIFVDYQSVSAHQIGGCHVDGDRLYVGIGDGGNPTATRDREVLLGKVVCLDLSGLPCPDNPWYSEGPPASYVFAYGFRNPFGVQVVGNNLFVAENGISIDRFLRVESGVDYLWNGSDTSIAVGADLVLQPAVSPVQLDHVPADHEHLGDVLGGRFVFSVFSSEPQTGVMSLAYDLDRGRPTGVPDYAVQYVGNEPQHVVAAAVGVDGLYFAGALPGPDGTSPIYRLWSDADNAHPVMIQSDWGQPSDARYAVLERHSCISCHSIGGQGGGIGPSLEGFGLNFRLRERLNSDGYEEQLRALNAAAGPEEQDRVAAREAVLAVSGRQRVHVWMEHFLQDPAFDNLETLMPDLGLTAAEAREIRDALVSDPAPPLIERAYRYARRNSLAIAVGFVGGVAGTGAIAILVAAVIRFRRRSRPGPATEDSSTDA